MDDGKGLLLQYNEALGWWIGGMALMILKIERERVLQRGERGGRESFRVAATDGGEKFCQRPRPVFFGRLAALVGALHMLHGAAH